MSDLSTHLVQVDPAQALKEVTINGLFDAHSPISFGGRRAEACLGLTWGYYGGRWGGAAVANGTLTLPASSTRYIAVERSTGTIADAASWPSSATHAKLYKVVTGTAAVTDYEDHRAGPGGVFDFAGVGTQGRHSVAIMAAGMTPSVSGGCAALATITSATNQPDLQSLDFDPSTIEYAQFAIPMPKKWNRGTITAKFHWSHASTSTNFGVVWGIQAVAVGDGDAIAAAYGTAVTVTDTGGTTSSLYISPETAAMTVAGSPAAEDLVYFRVYRNATDGADNLAIDARLHAVVLYLTTNAETDA